VSFSLVHSIMVSRSYRHQIFEYLYSKNIANQNTVFNRQSSDWTILKKECQSFITVTTSLKIKKTICRTRCTFQGITCPLSIPLDVLCNRLLKMIPK
jgi:hypothetical protein